MNWFFRNNGFVPITAVGILTVFSPLRCSRISSLIHNFFISVRITRVSVFNGSPVVRRFFAFYCFTNVTLVLRREIISNNLVYHDLMLRCFLFFSVEVKEDLEQMRKGIEELNISKTEEERNEGRF